jgi:hypothetical protein
LPTAQPAPKAAKDSAGQPLRPKPQPQPQLKLQPLKLQRNNFE